MEEIRKIVRIILKESPEGEEYISMSSEFVKPIGYYTSTIRGIKENINKLRRFKNNIISSE